jgi:predicted metalloprotease
MKWEGQRESENVEDLRDAGGGRGGGGMVFGGGGRRLGLGSVVLALVVGWALDINPLTLLGLTDGGPPPAAPAARPVPGARPSDDPARFVSTVLADTEEVWRKVLQSEGGGAYRDPKLVLFRGAVDTACGTGESAAGPFYCPGDQKVYIDLGFFDVLRSRLGSPGDFAQAYVVAHEVGHHVQNLLGTNRQVESQRARLSTAQMNALSVRVELQADCYAGVWAHHSQQGKGWLEQGDIDEALNAASHIGDDMLQRQSRGRVVPESFTHGTSAQRQSWFRRGYESGRMKQCDTFNSSLYGNGAHLDTLLAHKPARCARPNGATPASLQ